jgi:hypothetical protein
MELCVDVIEPKITSANHKSQTPNFKLQRLPPFSEQIMLRNVLKPSDLLPFITVRAEVNFRDTFVSNARDSIHFSSGILNPLSHEARIAITNPISAPRMLTWQSLNQIPARVGSDAHIFYVHCDVQLKTTGALRPKLTSIAVVQLGYLNVPPVPETNSCIGIFWGPRSCASKMFWNRAGCIEPCFIAHSNGDTRTRASISAFQAAFKFPLPNALSGLRFVIDVTTAM